MRDLLFVLIVTVSVFGLAWTNPWLIPQTDFVYHTVDKSVHYDR